MTDAWIKKRWYIYTVEYYSAIKKNEIDRFVGQGEVRKRKINIIYSCKYEKQMMIIGSRDGVKENG